MPRRAVWPTPLRQLTVADVARLIVVEADYDELVIAVTYAEHAFTAEHPRPAGERIERAGAVLRRHLRRPFALLPIKDEGLSLAQRASRLRVGLPAFESVICERAEEAALYAARLGCRVHVTDGDGDDGADLLDSSLARADTERSRGLFITRAQFFHCRHAAYVEQIAEELDEVIVLVARAETSHTLDNPATAGERIEMITPYLRRAVPGRYHLAAAPYVVPDAANFDELTLMLPRFHRVYTHDPSIWELAHTAGYPCRILARAQRGLAAISGHEVRRRIIAGEDYTPLLPPEIAQALATSPAIARLRRLAGPEPRGPIVD